MTGDNEFSPPELVNNGRFWRTMSVLLLTVEDTFAMHKSSRNDAWCLQWWEMKIDVSNETTCLNWLFILHHLSPFLGQHNGEVMPLNHQSQSLPPSWLWCGEWVLTEEDLWNSTTVSCHDGKKMLWWRWSRWNLVSNSYIMEVQGMNDHGYQRTISTR